MNTAKRVAALMLCLLLLTALITGCHAQEQASDEGETGNYPVTVGGLTLSSKPERVVVLSENLAGCV